MANNEFYKNSSNLKVPPLKIVLSSHQNNAVVNIKDADPNKLIERDNNGESNVDRDDISRRGSIDVNDSSKGTRGSSSNGNDLELGHTTNRAQSSSSSGSSTTSDRSASATPSSESESIASNSTIISDPQQSKAPKVEETTLKRQDRAARFAMKSTSSDRTSNNANKRSAETSDSGTEFAINKDQGTAANQRITRSSQRAAQQIKPECSETLGEESALGEIQDKTQESARKAKRRKADLQEPEPESGQSTAPQQPAMAKICPADYRLPLQNSFELYRDIRKRPYTQMMKLLHIQPKVPHGFKDYRINSGPYLLEGNKLGVGLNGAKLDGLGNQFKNSDASISRLPLRMKLSNLQKLSYYKPSSHQRHNSYVVPKLSETPVCLQVGTPLYELFQDQERARHQMRIQHLKERERSILTAEQEMLRAYNKAAIADVKQKLHLSACTYLYYQEKYHYIDDKSNQNGGSKTKEVPHSQDNSFLCIEGGEAKTSDSTAAQDRLTIDKNSTDIDSISSKEEGKVHTNIASTVSPSDPKIPIKKETDKNIRDTHDHDKSKETNNDNEVMAETKSNITDISGNNSKTHEVVKKDEKPNSQDSRECKKLDEECQDSAKQTDVIMSGSNVDKKDEEEAKELSDDDLRTINKEAFLSQLQDIDDKWAKIKKDMFVRHRNEADSLYAVQTLEWEWKAKEIGACDVRVSPKIEPEFVPRVEVFAIDY